MLAGVLIEHCYISRMAQRYGGPYQDFCRSCGNVEEKRTVQHVLCNCPALAIRRSCFLGKPFFEELGGLSCVWKT